MSYNNNIGVVILAAGRGSRLKCDDIPKVMCEIGGKPIVSYIVKTLESMDIPASHITMVVGYQKEKVIKYFGTRVQYAVQTELKGTAHAAYTGMTTLPREVEHVLVLSGDDSSFYSKESISRFIQEHIEKNMTVSLLSVQVEDPVGLGRIVRHDNGDIEVIEKEYATEEQNKIKEVSTGTFMFNRKWYEAMFPNMPQLRKLGEYGLPTSLAMVRANKKPYQVVSLVISNEWFGVNTPEQLAEANRRKES